MAAHAFAARRWPSAGSGRGVRSRRARGTGRADGYAPVAAQASAARRWPSTREGGRVTAEARGACEARIRSPLEPAPACRGSRGGTLGGHNVHEIPFYCQIQATHGRIQPGQWPGVFPRGEIGGRGCPARADPGGKAAAGREGDLAPPPNRIRAPARTWPPPTLSPLWELSGWGGGCPAPSVTARGGRRAGRSPPPPPSASGPRPGVGVARRDGGRRQQRRLVYHSPRRWCFCCAHPTCPWRPACGSRSKRRGRGGG